MYFDNVGLFKKYLFLRERDRERERASRGGAETQGGVGGGVGGGGVETQNPKQAPGSKL